MKTMVVLLSSQDGHTALIDVFTSNRMIVEIREHHEVGFKPVQNEWSDKVKTLIEAMRELLRQDVLELVDAIQFMPDIKLYWF